jgi:beta-mannosidase
METGWGLCCDIGPVAANLPDSVQSNLLRAGLLEDWNFGLNSRKVEWVENYHWEFTTAFDLPAEVDPADVRLLPEGLDYSGWILANGREVATFSGAMIPHGV